MNIGLIIFALFGSFVGLISTVYIVVAMFAVFGFKIYRKIKFGIKLYD